MAAAPGETAKVEQQQAEGAMQLALESLNGARVQLGLSGGASVRELRDAYEAATAAGPLAYSLLAGGTLLEPPEASLAALGVQDGATITVVRQRNWDYGKIVDFARTVKCLSYPNGVAMNRRGELLVSHYFGELLVYDAGHSVISNTRLPAVQPSQMTIAPSGELLVAFRSCHGTRGGGRVGVFGEDLQHLRWIRHERLENPSGVAVSGQKVFVSDMRSCSVSAYSLTDGERLQESGERFDRPGGLAVVDDRLLAVAERGGHRVRLLDLESLREVGRLPGAATGVSLKAPNDVAVDSGGNLLVMDTGNERIAVFREDGSLVASVMQGYFKDHGNTFSYLACNHATGAIAISNDDEHSIAMLAPLFAGS